MFGLLREERNLAVDAALAACVHTLDSGARDAVMDLLATRGNHAALLSLLDRFFDLDEEMQQALIERVHVFGGAIRVAVSAREPARRAAAIELIVRGDAGHLAYLLVEVLRGRFPVTRERAAWALTSMVELHVTRRANQPSVATREPGAHHTRLTEAVVDAVACFDRHARREVLRAAAWLGDGVWPAVRSTLDGGSSPFADGLLALLHRVSDPRLAGFVWRALTAPALRSAAVRAIAEATDPVFIRALLEEAWLLADEEVASCCRSIAYLTWVERDEGELLALPDACLDRLARLVVLSGMPVEIKEKLLRSWLQPDRGRLVPVAVWALMEDRSALSTTLLALVADRREDQLGRLAKREVARRRGQLAVSAANRVPTTPASAAFERYWSMYDQLTDDRRTQLEQTLAPMVPSFTPSLRVKLASGHAPDRSRALAMIRRLGLVGDLAEQVYHATHDPDPLVRSFAISLLASLPGKTTESILRRAVGDADQRVQANAIEALDLLNVPDRVACTAPKLTSANNRVRATAVKSLLRAELASAGEALLSMLEDGASDSRISALWVVQRLHLASIRKRIDAMSRQDPDPRVRQRAARVLRELAGGSTRGSTTPSPASSGKGAAR